MSLQQIAVKLATYYEENDKVDAVILGGSIAKGWDDFYSDVELFVLWAEAPRDEERKKPIQSVEGELLSFEAYEEEEWSEAYVTEGVKLEISSFLTSTINSWLNDVVDNFDDHMNKQMIVSVLATGIPLYGGDMLKPLQEKAILYPDQLGKKVIANHVDLGRRWHNREALLFREDWFMLRTVMLSVQSKILAQLFGLNRKYIQHPLFKWQKKCLEAMCLKPEGLNERMEKVLLNHPEKGLPILEALVNDMVKLISLHEPEIQVEQENDRFIRLKQHRVIILDRLASADADALFSFEVENRTYFEQLVPGRGDDYYHFPIFLERFGDLLEEQEKKEGAYYLIKDEKGTIMGRMNLMIANEGVELGYRVGSAFAGKGVAKQALSLLISEARTIKGVNKLVAKTTTANIGSQKVLERNGFAKVAIDEKPFEWKGEMQQFVHYELMLIPRTRSSVVILEEGNVALIKRTIGGNSYYVFPGGGVLANESLEEAARREAFEELGVVVEIGECIGKAYVNGQQYFFKATIQSGQFGTGQGKELIDSECGRGAYEPVWIKGEHLNECDVRPRELAETVTKQWIIRK